MAAEKLSTLSLIKKCLSCNQTLLLVNLLINLLSSIVLQFIYCPQFTYCPFIWMFCSRILNNSLNRIHERVLPFVHDNYNSSFHHILEISNEKTIHQRNLEHLAKEIYRFVKGLLPPIMNNFFSFRDTPYKLRNFQCLYSNNKNIVKY